MSLSLLNTQDNQIDLSNGIFRFMGRSANIVPDFDNPLFLANDIAKILGYSDTRHAILEHVDPEYKISWNEIITNNNVKIGGVETTPPIKCSDSVINTISSRIQNQSKTTFITESGLYELICSSKMEAAKEFKKWIFKDVIPSIRKTGSYKVELNKQQLLLETEKDKRIAELEQINKKYIAEIADIKIPVVLNEFLYALKLGNRVYHKFGRTVDDEKRKKQHIPEYGQDVEYEIKMQVYHSKLAESMLRYAFEDNMVYDVLKPAKVNKKGDVSDPVEEREGTNLPTDMVHKKSTSLFFD